MGRYGALFRGWLFCLWGAYGIDLWATVAAVLTLWGIYGALWLRCRPYGASMGRCGCGANPMGHIWGIGHIWGTVAALPTLWGIYGLL